MTAELDPLAARWGYTGRAVLADRWCLRCRKKRESAVYEREIDIGFFDERVCLTCGRTCADYGGWSRKTWCRPKPGHEAEWDGNPNPDLAVPPPVRYEVVSLPGFELLTPGGSR